VSRQAEPRADPYRYAGEKLHRHWERLHLGDREPWPDERRVSALARPSALAGAVAARGGAAAVAAELQQAWRDFHSGEFGHAIRHGSGLGALGASVANKAAEVQTRAAAPGEPAALKALTAAIGRGEAAVGALPDDPNAHYMLALVLGRYSQRISILKALAGGLAGRVRAHLERTLELEPRHAEAHLAFGLYHAEIVRQLGALAGRLTYGASAEAALDHFRRATRLAPALPIVHLEHAHALVLLDAGRYREEARALYARAAACAAVDAVEALDVARARRGLP
jgi:tetratricopeptide (TPR) repeat protein